MDQALPPFQAFLEEHLEAVRAFLRGMVGPTDAEDCLQETFIAALRAYPRAHSGNLRAWVFTIARRKAIDHQRSRSREYPTADVEQVVDRANSAPPADAGIGMSPATAQSGPRWPSFPPGNARPSSCALPWTFATGRSARPWARRRTPRGEAFTKA